ncbi:MAG: MBG domain-containing protein [Erysipelotrichaceae bacterium]|nr:MBG domain-containing protein [Erysipelotrichaceae bacterium]
MKRYRKHAKIAMAVALTTTSLTTSIENTFAKEEVNIEENTVEAKENFSLEQEKTTEEPLVEETFTEEVVENTSEKAVGNIVINRTNFPDDGFRNYIKNFFGKSENDTLSETERNRLTSIEARGTQENPRTDIRSLEGIQYFPKLVSLNLQYQTELKGNLDLRQHTLLQIIDLSQTKIDDINIDGLTNLTFFDIAETNIPAREFDFTLNKSMRKIYLYKTEVTSIKIAGLQELVHLDCANTNVSTLDVREFKKLHTLICSDTNITELDVSENRELVTLWCAGLELNELNIDNNLLLEDFRYDRGTSDFYSVDTSKQTALKILNCFQTSVERIDVSQNRELEELRCYETQIPSLDLSVNGQLNYLDCRFNNLTWLDIGDNPNLTTLLKSDSLFDLGVLGSSFNITNVRPEFLGIDPARVHIFSGATSYNPTTGEVSGYQNGTPIVYYYDCGTKSGGERVYLKVTLQFTIQLPSTITLTYQDQEYRANETDKRVPDPTNYTTTGSDGAVTFKWYERQADGSFVEMQPGEKPINVNEHGYGVQAILAANQTHQGAESNVVPFQITPVPSNIHINNYASKPWDGVAVGIPTDITRTQNSATVTFKYYHADDTTIEIPAPSEVGEYKVKAFLAGDRNYVDSESDFFDFRITLALTTITLQYPDRPYSGNMVSNPIAGEHYTVIGSAGDVTFEWYDANDITTPLAQAPINVGSYAVKATVAATNTHESASAIAYFKITPLPSSIQIDRYEGKVYDGISVELPKEVSREGSTGDVTFEWFEKDANGQWISLGEKAPINAGNYGVKAYLAADQNYLAADSGTPTAFTIEKAPSTIEILDDLNKIYDEKEVAEPANIEKTGSSGAVTLTWYKKEYDTTTRAITWIALPNAPVNVGEYKVVAYLEEDANYLDATGEKEFTIEKAPSTIEILDDLNKEYDGQEVTLPTNIVRTGSKGNITFKWYKKQANGEWELLEGFPKEVGEYKITAEVEEDENYLSTEAEKEFTITEKIEGVQTGDTTQTSMWTMLIGLSMSMMYFFRRKKNN